MKPGARAASGWPEGDGAAVRFHPAMSAGASGPSITTAANASYLTTSMSFEIAGLRAQDRDVAGIAR